MIKNFKILLILISVLIGEVCFSQTSVISDTIKLNYRNKEFLDTNFFNVFPKKINNTKVGLVLSGGGARGISQLGVLSVLEERGIQIDKIVGTSFGSVTGGLYSTGYSPNHIKEIFKGIDWINALSLNDKYQREYLFLDQKIIQDKSLLTISIDGITPTLPSSISSGQKLTELINILILNAKYHPKKNFQDLKIPFYAVATDFDKGEKVVLGEGNLSESIKASFTFPLLYSPININGKNLVDGGLTTNIPVDVAKEVGADYTITVNSTSPLQSIENITNPLYTADHILSITMNQLNNSQLQKSNEVITPDVENTSTFDFNRIEFLYNQGRVAALKSIDKIAREIDSMEYYSSKYFNNFLINPSIKKSFSEEIVSYAKIDDVILNYKDNKFIRYSDIEVKLKELYRSGYFESVEAEITGETNGASVNYILQTNDVLSNVISNSAYPFLTQAIDSFRTNNSGRVINFNEYAGFYDNLLGLLRDNNLSLIEIEKFYFNHYTKDLEIYFTDGFINNIQLSGNEKSNDDLIMRQLSFDREQLVEKDELENSLKNIFGTNLFKQVSFDYDFNGKKYQPDLKIRVVERSARNIRISGRVDNERNLQGYLDIRDENVSGTGLEIGGFFAGGLRNQYLEFEFKSNQLFKSPLTYDLSFYTGYRDVYEYDINIVDSINSYTRTQKGEYKDRKWGYSLLVGMQVEKLGTLYGKIGFENMSLKNISPNDLVREEYNTLKFKFGGNFDSRNVIPYSTSGSQVNFFYETSQNRLGSDVSYSKLFLNYEQYIQLGLRHTLKPKFVFGSEDKTTPLPEFFSIGGEDSFFGMVEDENRGRQILQASLEYRFKSPYALFFDTYFKLRYDLGRVWENTTDIRFKDLRHGLGASLCFDTPVGESSFSVGRTFLINKGLTQDSFILGPFTYYFSIGYKF